MKSGFNFIDFWAVDFDWHKGKPFEHYCGDKYIIIPFLVKCLWFQEHGLEVKEIPPNKVDEGCQYFLQK